ncbi:Hypothetical protein NAEGRDRAFT_65053 [Naegleria gruberi]|uniref:F-box domain-containing protein n=1 Tax=Naegleria gruberi TaxID=5762 RepID=D2V873_NAEGR|nr:uncharacterized protein NAEGRDRAFT_65053 [Naegleria gruberi]EFC46995.1 Hypothetical protein NAEGRDRAFT_65053 [Naegleria gruberi]|eukprot:XP_002679739.1 Hypothetical protein NAEGRDRAFT_65053 [Naegleria gruberi strain NEG-M]
MSTNNLAQCSSILSIDTLSIVVSYISLHDLCSFRCVSSDWNQAINFYTNNHHDHDDQLINIETLTQSSPTDADCHNNRTIGVFWLDKFKSFLYERDDRLKELFYVEHLKFREYVERYFYFHERRRCLKRFKKVENKIKNNSTIVSKFDYDYLKSQVNCSNWDSISRFIHNILNNPNRVIEYVESIYDFKDIFSNNLIYSDKFIKECVNYNRFLKNLIIYFDNNENISENVYNFIVNNYFDNNNIQGFIINDSVKLCKLLALLKDKSITLDLKDYNYLKIMLLKSIFIGYEHCKELKNLIILKCKTPENFFYGGTFENILNLVNNNLQKIDNDSFLKIVNLSTLFNVNIKDYLDYCIEIFSSQELQYQVMDYKCEHEFNNNVSKIDEYFHKIFPNMKCLQTAGVEKYYIKKLNRNMFTVVDNNNYIIHKVKRIKCYWDFFLLGRYLDEQFRENRELNYFKLEKDMCWLNLDTLMGSIELGSDEKSKIEENCALIAPRYSYRF